MRWLAGLVMFAVVLTAQPGAPPPGFSPQYVAALQGVVDLEPADAAALEKRLAANPEDYAARLKLMAYDLRADRARFDSSRRQRVELALWLVEHHPDSEILASPYAAFAPGELSGQSLDRAERLWHAALEKNPKNAKVQGNAAFFYSRADPPRYLQSMEAAVALAPGDERQGRLLGSYYAQRIVEGSASSRLAIERLDATANPFVLEGAVWVLKRSADKSLMFGQRDARLDDLAARYFARAKALDPKMDVAWVYPQMDPKMAGILAPGAPRPAPIPATKYRRLKPEAFPDLPPAIAAFLKTRGCSIPQPLAEKPLRNVIRGEFFEKGKDAWAVLCDVRGFSSILVFRDDAASRPVELAKYPDEAYAWQAWNGNQYYGREIDAIDRTPILRYYRGQGGPVPPPMDHQGIEDGTEHASEIYYWYRGQWRKLQGAD